MTIPNAITLVRLLLVPAFGALAYARSPRLRLLGGAVFAVCALTDWLDGFLARRCGWRSRLGTLLDPVVDKVMVLTALFVLADTGLMPLWIPLANMAREFLVTGARHALTTPDRVEGANWMGKLKFCGQVAVVLAAYAVHARAAAGLAAPWEVRTVVWAAAGVTALSVGSALRFLALNRAALLEA